MSVSDVSTSFQDAVRNAVQKLGSENSSFPMPDEVDVERVPIGNQWDDLKYDDITLPVEDAQKKGGWYEVIVTYQGTDIAVGLANPHHTASNDVTNKWFVQLELV